MSRISPPIHPSPPFPADFSTHDNSIPDPALSELGIKQCQALQENLKNLPLANEVKLIVVSPMRRTLQTATLCLGWLIERGVPVMPDAGWQGEVEKIYDLPL